MEDKKSEILIKNVLCNDVQTDILIRGNRIATIAPNISSSEDMQIINKAGLAAIPGFYNCHTHAAMTLFRGYGDDLPLMKWLNDYIWPAEAHMTDEDIYHGAKLACLEMIKSGTVAFLDMYASPHATARAVEEMGLRAVLSYTLFDRGSERRAELDRKNCKKYLEEFKQYSDRIQFAVGPHAIYTVSGKMLQYCHEFAAENDLLIHLHLSETEGEVKEAVEKYGLTPVRYLKKLGILSPNLVLAHMIWVDEEEMQMVAEAGCRVVHNPASNLKLASGYRFQYEEMKKKNILIGLGTDGCSSSNNLDMIMAMKLASFIGKAWRFDSTAVSAYDIFHTATKDGAKLMRIDAGEIRENALADLSLVNLKRPEMTPNHNLVSNLVYSASGSVIDTVIVDGKILMRDGKVDGEEAIMNQAAASACRLVKAN